jgi:hypothetical protein
MRVTTGEEEAAADTAASVEGDMLVSAVGPILAQVVAATVELGSTEPLVRMRQGPIHPAFQTAALARTGKSTTHHERRVERRFMAQVRGHKIGPLPGSLLARHATRVAITFRKIDPGLVLRVSPLSSRVIM